MKAFERVVRGLAQLGVALAAIATIASMLLIGYSVFMRFDEETLKAIAQLTSAEYFHAASAADLKRVYETLNARYVLERQETEISALLSALAAVLVLAAAGLSIVWFSRLG